MAYDDNQPKRNLEALKWAFKEGYPVRFDYRAKEDEELRQRYGTVREVKNDNLVIIADLVRRGYRGIIVDRIIGDVRVDTP